MKPTPHFNSCQRDSHDDRRNFPLTDYSFQSTAETVARPSAISAKGVSELRTFRKVSKEFFGVEAGRDYLAEAILFVCLSCVAAWPIAITIHQLTRWMI
jgi:hypothetical protein